MNKNEFIESGYSLNEVDANNYLALNSFKIGKPIIITQLPIDDRIRHLKNDISIYIQINSIYRTLSCLERLTPLLMENIIKKHC